MERCVLCSKHILPILHSFVLQFKKFLSLSLSQRRKDPKQSKWKDVYCAPSIVCQFYIAFFFSLRNSSLSLSLSLSKTTYTNILSDRHNWCKCFTKLSACFLAGLYRPNRCRFDHSISSCDICILIDPTPWNYCSNVSGCMAGFHHFYPSDCSLFLVSG